MATSSKLLNFFRNALYNRFLQKISLIQKGVLSIRREGFKNGFSKSLQYLIRNKDVLTMGLRESDYSKWIKKNSCSKRMTEKEVAILNDLPKISIIMPVYNVDLQWLTKGINSVRNQLYKNWELCIVDDGSTDRNTVNFLKSIHDPNIKIKFLEKNQGISIASNLAIQMTTGEYIGLMDHDDEITKDALFEVVKMISQKSPDLIYSDEDKIDRNGNRKRPFFKPDWSPDLLRAQNYICHFTVIKKSELDNVKGFRKEFDGAQDHDLFLRISERTDKIYHIPKVLYSWREIETSTASNPFSKPRAQTAGLKAVSEHVKRVFEKSAFTNECEYLFVFDVRVPPPTVPMVSIIIPTKDKLDLLYPCVKSILTQSTYKKYEIIILDNNSEKPETHDWFKDITEHHANIKVVQAPYPFCWSKLNNHGIKKACGEVFIFLNNDTEVISNDWIERLTEQAVREGVGAVGPLLLRRDGSIQHAGVVVGIGGWADHIFKAMRPIHLGSPYVSPMVKRNVLAVTGSCLAISKKTIDDIGGFDENFMICGSDVEMCIRAYERGLYNIYDPFVKLYHLESKTRIPEDIPNCDFEMSKKHYGKYTGSGVDPFFNVNLSLNSTKPLLKE